MCSFHGSYANRGNGTELSSSDVVPVVGLDLRCGAGHLGLQHAAGMLPSALGFESLSRIKKAEKANCLLRFFWCRWWDSNPHGVATNGF